MPGQTVPQLPQLLRSVLVSTQPLPQRINGARHWKSQDPALHTGLALPGAKHTIPHLPQSDVALEVSTHEPSQLVSAPQSVPQLPPLHTMPAPHLFVQLPQ